MQRIHATYWADVPENYTGIVIWENSSVVYFNNGQVHRVDGPAYTLGTNIQWWYEGNRLPPEEHFNIVFQNADPEFQTWMLFNLDLWSLKGLTSL